MNVVSAYAPKLEKPEDWTAQALCTRPENRPTRDRDIWDSRDPREQAEARAICAACPVRAECAKLKLEGAGITYAGRTIGGHIWGGPRPCKDCRRPLRPNGAAAADYPGTLQHSGRGLCSTCSEARTTPKRCKTCDRELRPNGTPPAEAPGTVAHVSGGRCTNCHREHIYATTTAPYGQCAACDVVLRHPKTPAANIPDAVPAYSKTWCHPCNTKRRKKTKK